MDIQLKRGLLAAAIAVLIALLASLWSVVASLWSMAVSLAVSAGGCPVLGILAILEGQSAYALVMFACALICAILACYSVKPITVSAWKITKAMELSDRTGDIELCDVIAAGNFYIERSTGNITLEGGCRRAFPCDRYRSHSYFIESTANLLTFPLLCSIMLLSYIRKRK